MSVNGAVAGATTEQLEEIKADLEKQRDERITQVINSDPLLRELTGAIKGVEFALNGPPPVEEGEEPAE